MDFDTPKIVLVTGCAGFIGSHLCEQLLIRGDLVYGIDNMNNYYNTVVKEQNLAILKKFDNFTFYQEDLVTTDIIDRVNFDVVVNLGAMAGVRNSIENPEIYMRTNVEGTTHLLDRCVKNGIKLFVYASSSSVYGLNTKVPFSETDKIDLQNSPYALSKKMSEEIACFYNRTYGISTIGLRFFTVYGPRGRPDMAPYKFLKAIMNNELFDKYGDGNSYRDYTYISDIVTGIVGAIDKIGEVKSSDKNICEVYNLGNSKPISLNEFIKVCEEITGKKANFRQLEEQKGDVPVTYADINKAVDELDYIPMTNIRDGLTETFRWLNL